MEIGKATPANPSPEEIRRLTIRVNDLEKRVRKLEKGKAEQEVTVSLSGVLEDPLK